MSPPPIWCLQFVGSQTCIPFNSLITSRKLVFWSKVFEFTARCLFSGHFNFPFFVCFCFFCGRGVLSSSRHAQKMAAGHGERLCSTLNFVALMCIDNIYIGRYGLTDLVYFDMGAIPFLLYLFICRAETEGGEKNCSKRKSNRKKWRVEKK